MPTDFEDQLRQRLAAHAETVQPDPGTWDRVREGIRRGQRFRWLHAGAAATAVAAIAAVAVLVLPGVLSGPDVGFEPGVIQQSETPTPAPSPTTGGDGTPVPAVAPSLELVLVTSDGLLTVPPPDPGQGHVAIGTPGGDPVETVAVRTGSSPDAIDMVTAGGCGLVHHLMSDASYSSAVVVSPAQDACPTGPRFSPDGGHLAWAELTDGGVDLGTVGWDDEGEVEASNAHFILDLARLAEAGIAELASVRVVDWFWAEDTGTAAQGFLALVATDTDGLNYLLILEIERQGDGALALPTGSLVPHADEGRRLVAFQRSSTAQWALAVDGRGLPTLFREVEEVGSTVLTDDLPAALGDGGPVWLAVAGDTAVFGDGVGNAWTVTYTDDGWTEVAPLSAGAGDPEIFHGAVIRDGRPGMPGTETAEPMPDASAEPDPTPTPTPEATATPTEPLGEGTEEPGPDVGDLPALVAEKRDAVRAAAAAGDLQAMEALTDSEQFTFSYGASDSPSAFWQAEIDNGIDVPAQVVALLDLPHTASEAEGGPSIYTWPSAFDRPYESLSSAELVALEAAVGPQVMETYEQTGQYLGYRLGIRADGAWIYLVAGD